eukprot:6195803-Pleurochrysis_carterae.AAC.1
MLGYRGGTDWNQVGDSLPQNFCESGCDASRWTFLLFTEQLTPPGVSETNVRVDNRFPGKLRSCR